MKRKMLRKIFGTLSFTGMLFVFQACYGAPQDMYRDIYIEGVVKSNKTSLPLSGIKVSVSNNQTSILTDEDGKFKIYTLPAPELLLKFEDIDEAQNGMFQSKDTLVKPNNKAVFITIGMDAK